MPTRGSWPRLARRRSSPKISSGSRSSLTWSAATPRAPTPGRGRITPFAAGARPPGAARCAFWLGFTSLIQGETAQSGGWLARGQRLLDDGRHDCLERGYLLMLQALRCMWAGDNATLHATYDQAARIGERFGDAQLMAFGRLGVGEALIRSGQTAAGVALFDEVMVAVTTGEVSQIGVGIPAPRRHCCQR